MKAIHASYLVAITVVVFVAFAGSLGKALAQGSSSSEDFLIKTQLNTAPQVMPYLCDSYLPGTSIVKANDHLAGPQLAHGGSGPAGHRLPGPDPEFLKSLALTDEQREKLHAIREKQLLASAARMSELIKLRHQLFELVTAANKADGSGDALAIQKQINSLDNANQLDRLESMLESKAVFTDEQQKQLRRHLLEHEPLMGPGGPACGPGPMGPMGPGGGPPGGGPGRFGGPSQSMGPDMGSDRPMSGLTGQGQEGA